MSAVPDFPINDKTLNETIIFYRDSLIDRFFRIRRPDGIQTGKGLAIYPAKIMRRPFVRISTIRPGSA